MIGKPRVPSVRTWLYLWALLVCWSAGALFTLLALSEVAAPWVLVLLVAATATVQLLIAAHRSP